MTLVMTVPKIGTVIKLCSSLWGLVALGRDFVRNENMTNTPTQPIPT